MSETNPQNRIAAALEYLAGFTNYERNARYAYTGAAMNLERVRRLLAAAGSPEKGLPAVHLAGTKGKGSTARMVHSILSAAGYRAGLYTSPHLVSQNERIQVNEETISDHALAQAIEALRPGVDAVHAAPELGELTYFEFITAIAFYHFAKKDVDYAVLETGLGGRFDATNVCEPRVAVLTPISFDHTDLLGNTLAKIASEKAQIIKPGGKVVVAAQPEEAQKIIEARAAEMGAKIFESEKFYETRLGSIYPFEMSFDLTGKIGKRKLAGLKTRMVGPVQMQNAATAVLTCDLLVEAGAKISDDTIRYGLARARLAGRFSPVEFAGRTLVLDGAHNAASARALAETLAKVYPGKKFKFIIGVGGDKDLAGFLAELKPLFESVIFTAARHPRAASPGALISALGSFGGAVTVAPDVATALGKISSFTRPGEIVIVTGSFFLIGEAISWLTSREIDIQIP